MIQRRERLRLAREARQAIRIARDGLWQDFQRDLAIQPCIARAVDLAHAAGPEERDDFVGTKPGAGSQRRKYRGMRPIPSGDKGGEFVALDAEGDLD